MKRIVDIYRKDQRDQVLWTYIISLGADGSHPSLEDFKREAVRLAVLDKLDSSDRLDAHVHLDPIK